MTWTLWLSVNRLSARLSRRWEVLRRSLAREINPTAYSPVELRSKLKAGHHFLTAVTGGEKNLPYWRGA